MKTITKTVTAYQYDELSETAKGNAINQFNDINVDYDWWDCTYEDAKTCGLKITGFDIDRGRYAKGDFYESAEKCADLIIGNHGVTCETYKTAEKYIGDRDEIITTADKDEDGNFADEYALDKKLDELDAEFLNSILEDYSIILQKDYEYLTSREAIEDTIRINEYEFTKDGKFPAI